VAVDKGNVGKSSWIFGIHAMGKENGSFSIMRCQWVWWENGGMSAKSVLLIFWHTGGFYSSNEIDPILKTNIHNSFDRKLIWPKTFRLNDHFSKKAFGQMNFQSCHFGHLTNFSSYIFGQMTIFQLFLIKRPFDKFCFRPNYFFR
jgi:hypothetical protein